ncbi:hypothetical protein [Nonomuraea typhae]|uniref:Uncharacterized protein n=1 Tax=Nonomuraea typhae TaxID=2603600 RepID=A0ABW7Z694_9ACTN
MNDPNGSLVIADQPVTPTPYRIGFRKRTELYGSALGWASALTRAPHRPALVIAHAAVIFAWLAEATGEHDLHLRHLACNRQHVNQAPQPADDDPEGFLRRAAELYHAILRAA